MDKVWTVDRNVSFVWTTSGGVMWRKFIIKLKETLVAAGWTLRGVGMGTGTGVFDLVGTDPLPAFPSVVGTAAGLWTCLQAPDLGDGNPRPEVVLQQPNGTDECHVHWRAAGGYTDAAIGEATRPTAGLGGEDSRDDSVDQDWPTAAVMKSSFWTFATAPDGSYMAFNYSTNRGAAWHFFLRCEDVEDGDQYPYVMYFRSSGTAAMLDSSILGFNAGVASLSAYHPTLGKIYPANGYGGSRYGSSNVANVVAADVSPVDGEPQMGGVWVMSWGAAEGQVKGRLPDVYECHMADTTKTTTGDYVQLGHYLLPWMSLVDDLMQLPPPPVDLVLYAKWNTDSTWYGSNTVLCVHSVEDTTVDAWNNWSYWDYAVYGGTTGMQGYNGAVLTNAGKWGSRTWDLRGSGNRHVYSGVGGEIFDGRLTDNRVASMSAWVCPNYNGSPATSVGLFAWAYYDWSGGSYNAAIVYHDAASGKLSIGFGTPVHAVIVGPVQSTVAWNPTAGTWYHIETCWNLATGNQYLFIDGILVGTGALTCARNACKYAGFGRVDNMPAGLGGPHVSDHYVQDLVFFDGVRHTADFPVPTTPETYVLENPFNLTYARGGGSLLGRPRGTYPPTRIGIDGVDPKVGAGCFDLSLTTESTHTAYIGFGLIDELENTGTVSFWVWVPAGAPTATEYFFLVSNGTFSVINYGEIYVAYTTAKELRFAMRNATGTSIFDQTKAWGPAAGWHHIEVAFDTVGNRYLIFADGIKLHDSAGTAGNRVAIPNNRTLCIGNTASGTSTYNEFKIDDFRIYDNIKHTADFVPDTTELDFS
jgi:hypothetical protein